MFFTWMIKAMRSLTHGRSLNKSLYCQSHCISNMNMIKGTDKFDLNCFESVFYSGKYEILGNY